MTKPSEFHVGIKNPVAVRRELLESTRAVIHVLQRYEKFNGIRKEKREKVHSLQKLMKDIESLNIKLKQVFPKIPLQKSRTNVRAPQQKILPKPQEIDKLEAELEHIESKLSSMK